MSSSSDTTLGYPIYSYSTSNSSISNNVITTKLAAGVSGIFITQTSNTLISSNDIQAGTGITVSGSTCNSNYVYQNDVANCSIALRDTGTNTVTTKPSTSILLLNCPSLNGVINPAEGRYIVSNKTK